VDADKDVDGDKDLDADKKAARTGDLSAQTEWRELQGRFVDDPQSTVKEAGALIERELTELRSRSENGSTEDLRTAFRRYRDLHAALN
jgi:hypothetical protein